MVLVWLAALGLLGYVSWRWWAWSVALVVGLLPTYLLRTTVFGLPTNFLELGVGIVAIVGLVRWVRKKLENRKEKKENRERCESTNQHANDANHETRITLFLNELPREVMVLAGLFLASAIISTVISDVPRVSLGILKGWIVTPMILGSLVYVAVRQEELENRKEKTPLRQGFQPSPRLRPAGVRQAENRGHSFLSAVFSFLTLSGLTMALIGLSQVGTLERVRGVYDVPNSLALYLAPLIVMAFWRGLLFDQSLRGLTGRLPAAGRKQSRGFANNEIAAPSLMSEARNDGGVKRFFSLFSNFYTLAAAVMFAALVATQSAAGVAAVLFSLLFGLVLWWRQLSRRVLAFGLWASFVIWILALGFLVLSGRLSYFLESPTSTSAAVRLQLWDVGWELVREHPLLGVGLGQFEPPYQEALHERAARGEVIIPEFVFRDPHNWMLAFWLNTGLLGLLSFVGIHVVVLKRAFLTQKIENGKEKTEAVFVQALTLALVTLLLLGLVDTIYWKNDLAALQWVLLALLMASVDRNRLATTVD